MIPGPAEVYKQSEQSHQYRYETPAKVSTVQEDNAPVAPKGESPVTEEEEDGALPGMRDLQNFYSEVKSRSEGVVGAVFDTYIMVEREGSLYFIDFHAAHERFLYDELMSRDIDMEKQELLVPEMLELPPGDYQLVLDNLSIFSEIGFDIEDFSDNSITVRAVPVKSGKLDIRGFIRGFIEELQAEQDTTDMRRAIAASAACHLAKRAGDSLSSDDMQRIARGVFHGGHELRCPHGRPFVHRITRNDLERIFKRS